MKTDLRIILAPLFADKRIYVISFKICLAHLDLLNKL